MTPIEAAADDYLEWMEIHNYARTTIEGRGRYLGYFITFAEDCGISEAKDVTLELLLSYQHALFAHRKRNGQPLSFGTQAQRLVPGGSVLLLAAPEHRIDAQPGRRPCYAPPRPATTRGHPERRRDGRAAGRSRCLEAPWPARSGRARSLLLLRAAPERTHRAVAPRRRLRAGHRVRAPGEGGQGPLRAHRRAGPVLGAALRRDRPARPSSRARFPDHLFLSSVGHTALPRLAVPQSTPSTSRLAGIEKRGSCHLLRHTVATLMLEGGADIRYVAEMLGHARLETTQRYTRVSIDRLRAVHTACHPAAGMNVAAASELCAALPQARSAIASSKTSRSHPRTA